jgi:hypothetical protein
VIELLPDFQHKPLDACAILYAIPATAVLGAILVTGFLGGAICAHVRIGELGSPPEMFAQSIALGTLVIAFAVAAVATNSCETAAWIWSPLVSISVAVVAAAIAAGIFALRLHRAAQNIT